MTITTSGTVASRSLRRSLRLARMPMGYRIRRRRIVGKAEDDWREENNDLRMTELSDFPIPPIVVMPF